jgi:hypothetical protein
MKSNKITSKVVAVLLAIMILPVLLMGCGSTKVSKEVREGTLKYINIFETHKKDNYSEPTKQEMNEYIEFVNSSKAKATPEEKEVLNKLGDVMLAYSTDSSEVSKGGKPILFDEKVKELKTLLEQYK